MVEKENSVKLPSRSRIRCARRDGWPLGSKNNTGTTSRVEKKSEIFLQSWQTG
jgi:hypothetical protein